MATPTTATLARTSRTTRHLLVFVVTLLAALLAAPAIALPLAQPTDGPTPPPDDGPDDVLQIAPQLLVAPDCNPDGFHYKAILPEADEGAVYHGEWREAPAGPVQALPPGQTAGFVPSGEGDFQVRGTYVSQDVVVHHFDWKDVTVDCPELQLPPNGRTEVTIDADPLCAPDTGISYAIEATGVPNVNIAYEAQYRELGGQVQSVDGQAGTIAVGEGTYEIRGLLHLQGNGFHASDWAEVTVDCPDDPGDDPEDQPEDEPQDQPEDQPQDEPETGVDPDDVPRPATPTFTG